MELPTEISTASGSYKITDTRKFLIGQIVSRDNSVAVGTAYDEDVNADGLTDTWELSSWSADSKVATADGAEFVGTWNVGVVQEAPPQTGDTENLLPQLCTAFVSAAAFGFTALKFKRRKHL
jgi:hypothetical protein